MTIPFNEHEYIASVRHNVERLPDGAAMALVENEIAHWSEDSASNARMRVEMRSVAASISWIVISILLALR